jgi:hypothetical protein
MVKPRYFSAVHAGAGPDLSDYRCDRPVEHQRKEYKTGTQVQPAVKATWQSNDGVIDDSPIYA